jgi:hypothetical protein
MAFRHGVLGEKEEGSELTALQDTVAASRPALTLDSLIDNGSSRRRACLSRGALMSASDLSQHYDYLYTSFYHPTTTPSHTIPHHGRYLFYKAVADLHIPPISTHAVQRFLHHGRPRYVNRASNTSASPTCLYPAKRKPSAMSQLGIPCSRQNCCLAEQGRAKLDRRNPASMSALLRITCTRRKTRYCYQIQAVGRRSLSVRHLMRQILRQVHHWCCHFTMLSEPTISLRRALTPRLHNSHGPGQRCRQGGCREQDHQ